MNAVSAERNLLFGVLAFHDGVIDAQRLDYVCRLAAVRRTAVVDILQERSWIEHAKRHELDAALARTLAEHEGDPVAALRAALDEKTAAVLRAINHPSVRAAMAALQRPVPALALAGAGPLPEAAPPREASPARRLPAWTPPPGPAPAPVRRERVLRRLWRRFGRAVLVTLGVLVVAALAVGFVVEHIIRVRSQALTSAAMDRLEASLDALSRHVRQLTEEPLPLEQKKSPLRRALLKRDRELLQRLTDTPGDLPAILLSRGRAYTEVARIDLSLGATSAAIDVARQGVDVLERLGLGRDGRYRGAQAAANAALGDAYFRAGKIDDALLAYGLASGFYDGVVHDFPHHRDYRRASAEVLLQICELNRRRFRWDTARGIYVRVRPILEQLAAESPGDLRIQYELGVTLRGLYSSWNNDGHFHEARDAFDACVPLARRLITEHPDVPECQYLWARVLWPLGNAGMREIDRDERTQCACAGFVVGGGATVPALAALMCAATARQEAELMRRAVEEARRSLHEGVEIADRLAAEEPDISDYSELAAQLRVVLAHYDAVLGEPRKATSQVEEALEHGKDGMLFFNAAGVYAQCGVSPVDGISPAEWTALREHYAKRAVELLKQARAAGFPYQTGDLRKSPEYAWLTGRDDYRSLDQAAKK